MKILILWAVAWYVCSAHMDNGDLSEACYLLVFWNMHKPQADNLRIHFSVEHLPHIHRLSASHLYFLCLSEIRSTKIRSSFASYVTTLLNLFYCTCVARARARAHTHTHRQIYK